jgi:hypothetical protein
MTDFGITESSVPVVSICLPVPISETAPIVDAVDPNTRLITKRITNATKIRRKVRLLFSGRKYLFKLIPQTEEYISDSPGF